MTQQYRSKQGKFLSKSEENRQVRSIRLTNRAWDGLGRLASIQCITRADLIEDWFKNGSFALNDYIKELELKIENLNANSISLPDSTLLVLNKIANEQSITREELITRAFYLVNVDKPSVDHKQLSLMTLEYKNNYDQDQLSLNNSELATRLGIDASNLSKKRRKSTNDELFVYTQSKDPEGIGWIYSQNTKLYFPGQESSQ